MLHLTYIYIYQERLWRVAGRPPMLFVVWGYSHRYCVIGTFVFLCDTIATNYLNSREYCPEYPWIKTWQTSTPKPWNNHWTVVQTCWSLLKFMVMNGSWALFGGSWGNLGPKRAPTAQKSSKTKFGDPFGRIVKAMWYHFGSHLVVFGSHVGEFWILGTLLEAILIFIESWFILKWI